jgi:Tfp pilus assembly protein PilN
MPISALVALSRTIMALNATSTPTFAALTLDFATSSQLSHGSKRLGVLLLLAGALGLGIGALQLKQAYYARAAQEQRSNFISHRMQTLKEQAANTRNRKTDVADPQELARSRAARQAATELQMPWAELLSALETAPTQNVAVLSIEPSAARRSVKLTAEAKHPQAMIAYLAALQKDKRLTQVMLTQHQVQMQTAGTPVRFQVQAYWGGGFAGAPEIAPTAVVAPANSTSTSTPVMANNAAQTLPQPEQNALANQMGINPQTSGNAPTDIAARNASNASPVKNSTP